ncbi:MAG: 23S rRNA (adenine(2503)-C(2))-methyltransferase RlmN [Candidatus Latescibacteria bacterium]|nr:23S rRNA (adenine(2503)-C(2))-methyltransferase RlmN [Candidatus Latescibacterota bacterium]
MLQAQEEIPLKETTVQADKVDLKGLLPDELEALIQEWGQPGYKSRQLLAWIYGRGVSDWQAMTDLSKVFRQKLAEEACITRLTEDQRNVSTTGQAIKFLFALPGGERVESVLIIDGKRRTACLSSQVGCALDCKFCATGKMGFMRNLTAAEIIDQLVQVDQVLRAQGERVTNVVMMGMGEPLLNYDQVVRAIRLMRLEMGTAVGGRRITVSTAGCLPGIQRLSREGLNVGLAVSLNATTDEIREQLMPINRKYKIAQLLEASAEYFELSGRRPTFEYILMDGVTDADDDALRLAELTRGSPCKINLIPYNELGPDSQYRRPPNQRLARFRRLLEERSPMAVTMRESRGRDIDAACGQLYQAQQRRRPAGSRRALA